MKPTDSKPSIGKVTRSPIKLSQEKLIETEALNGDKMLPLLIMPSVGGFDPISFAKGNREFIQTNLYKYGGILFRGINIESAAGFERFIDAICGAALEYTERSSPRSQVAGNIYTSTDYPPDQKIFLHNEHSYRHNFPLKIFFYCAVPASKGGQTPIADVRRVFHRISAPVRQKFMEKQVMYVRNFGSGLGLPWQTTFQTNDKAEVENYCRAVGIQVEWRENNCLRTRQIRPAAVPHPVTGEMVWFNHATFFHVSTLPPSIRKALLAEWPEELPNNTYYGDGTDIEPSVLNELRQCYEDETVDFDWQKGDVLVLDNMLVAHGRSPFEGDRKVLVGMADLSTSVSGAK